MMTKWLVQISLTLLMSSLIFGMNDADDTEISISEDELATISIDMFSQSGEDILKHIFKLTGDIKSNSLTQEKRAQFNITINNFYQTFNRQSIVAILPLVCKKFNEIIDKMRKSGQLTYTKPRIMIPTDSSKVKKLCK
jgi:hypothetical protein